MTRRLQFALVAVGLLVSTGCSGTDNSSGFTGVGGNAPSGGAASTGGASNGAGSLATGGALAAGGTASIGGSASVGGSVVTGGGPTAGGANAAGGNATTGGAMASGGAAATGGSKAVGGNSTAGGNIATGGAVTTGGSKAIGGSPATGGATTTGGSKSTASTTGGAVATGGTQATGGATGTGGSSGACAASPCGSHNWACWHMPNPAGLGLPNVASYTDLGDGTIRDNVTCLIWQKGNLTSGSTNTFTFADAQTACAASTVAGQTWRTATRVELTSIDDFSRTSGVAINTTYFTALSGYTWTATPWVVSQIATKAQDAWMINFADGLTSNGASQTGAYYTRCVTNGDGTTTSSPVIPPNQYTTVATGEIQDNYTGLIWQQADSVSTMAQPDAVTYCTSLALNGHSGWRLPSVREMATLVDDNPPIAKVSPAINQTVFSTTAPSTPYWTSSLYKGQAVSAHDPWTLTFTDGFTNYSNTAAIAKCVR